MKTIAFLLFFIASLGLSAQQPDTLKPRAKAFSTEVMLNLTEHANTISLQPNGAGIKFRYFYRQRTAFRGMLSYTQNSNQIPMVDTSGRTGKDLATNQQFNLGLGIERHLKGTRRLSPYYGADLGFGYGYRGRNWTNFDGNTFRNGFNRDLTNDTWTVKTNLFFGADFYVAENVFLGAEFGWSVVASFDSNGRMTYYGPATTGLSGVNARLETTFTVNTVPSGGIRLGIVF